MGAEAFDPDTRAKLIRPATYDEALAWFRAGTPFPYAFVNETGAVYKNGDLIASVFGGPRVTEGWWMAWQTEKQDDGSILGDIFRGVAFVGLGALTLGAAAPALGAVDAVAAGTSVAEEVAALGGTVTASGAVVGPIAPVAVAAGSAGALSGQALAEEVSALGGTVTEAGAVVGPIAPVAVAPGSAEILGRTAEKAAADKALSAASKSLAASIAGALNHAFVGNGARAATVAPSSSATAATDPFSLLLLAAAAVALLKG